MKEGIAERTKEIRITRPEHEKGDTKTGTPEMKTAIKHKKPGGKQKGTKSSTRDAGKEAKKGDEKEA